MSLKPNTLEVKVGCELPLLKTTCFEKKRIGDFRQFLKHQTYGVLGFKIWGRGLSHSHILLTSLAFSPNGK